MEEIDLRELISIFMRKKFLIIIVVIITSIIGAIYTANFIVPEYTSTASLILAQVNELTAIDATKSITSTDITLNSNLVGNYIELAKSKLVASQVIENLKLDMDLKTFQSGVSITTLEDTEVIRITVTNVDPQLACDIANEIAKVFMEKTEYIFKVSNVHIVDIAEVSDNPSNINLLKNIFISACLGFILVSAYILLINMLDTTVKTDTDIEKLLKVPVLTSIILSDDSVKKKTKSKSKFKSKSKSKSKNKTEEKKESLENK